MKIFLVLLVAALAMAEDAAETKTETKAETTDALSAVVQAKSLYQNGNTYYPQAQAHGDKPPRQHPCVWKALKDLKGDKTMKDTYPYLYTIPETYFRCDQVHQPGFYADEETGCQVIRRCDPNGGMSSYLCPVGTIFNQITLTCDWAYNVDCERSDKYRDYSNPRLYHSDWPLLDDCDDYPVKNNYNNHHDNDNDDDDDDNKDVYKKEHHKKDDYKKEDHHKKPHNYRTTRTYKKPAEHVNKYTTAAPVYVKPHQPYHAKPEHHRKPYHGKGGKRVDVDEDDDVADDSEE